MNIFFSEIVRYMEYLNLKYPKLVEVITIGHSYEGQPIKMVKISNGRNKKNGSKSAVWIDAGEFRFSYYVPHRKNLFTSRKKKRKRKKKNTWKIIQTFVRGSNFLRIVAHLVFDNTKAASLLLFSLVIPWIYVQTTLYTPHNKRGNPSARLHARGNF